MIEIPLKKMNWLTWLSALMLSVSIAPSAETSKSGTGKASVKAEDVINRFVEKIGGTAAFAKLTSQHATGKIDMAGQGITGELEVMAKRPDKLLIKIKLGGVGELLQGFDGTVGWSVNPITGPMVLEGKMLDQLKEQARFDSVLHSASDLKSMELVGKAQFEGKDCYQLKLVHKSGQESTEYYEVETGLLFGTSEVQETPLGPIQATGIVDEYKKFGEILFATKLTQKMGPLGQTMTFTKIEFNTVEDSVFELPESIKALTKK